MYPSGVWPVMAWTLRVRSATVNPAGLADRAEHRGQGGADPCLVQVDAADLGPPDLGGQRQLVERAVGQEADVDAVQAGAEPPDHVRELRDDL